MNIVDAEALWQPLLADNDEKTNSRIIKNKAIMLINEKFL